MDVPIGVEQDHHRPVGSVRRPRHAGRRPGSRATHVVMGPERVIDQPRRLAQVRRRIEERRVSGAVEPGPAAIVLDQGIDERCPRSRVRRGRPQRGPGRPTVPASAVSASTTRSARTMPPVAARFRRMASGRTTRCSRQSRSHAAAEPTATSRSRNGIHSGVPGSRRRARARGPSTPSRVATRPGAGWALAMAATAAIGLCFCGNGRRASSTRRRPRRPRRPRSGRAARRRAPASRPRPRPRRARRPARRCGSARRAKAGPVPGGRARRARSWAR